MLKQDHVNNQQLEKRKFIQNCLTDTIMPPEHKINNLGLFLKTGSLSHILFCNEAYEMIKEKPGVIMEFGVWYGNNQILFENLRAIHEPFNKLRKIVGFDTFDGYPDNSKNEEEAKNEFLEKGIYDVGNDYLDLLKKNIVFHQENNILGHKLNNELIVGCVEDTLEKYLEENNHTVISLVYLDLALYKSTKFVLSKIKPFLIKGSVIIFDEFNHPLFKGDTLAFREILNDIDYEIKISKFMKEKTFLIIK